MTRSVGVTQYSLVTTKGERHCSMGGGEEGKGPNGFHMTVNNWNDILFQESLAVLVAPTTEVHPCSVLLVSGGTGCRLSASKLCYPLHFMSLLSNILILSPYSPFPQFSFKSLMVRPDFLCLLLLMWERLKYPCKPEYWLNSRSYSNSPRLYCTLASRSLVKPTKSLMWDHI